jgi:hypothetical protein
MGWERRGNAGYFFYRSRRDAEGRIVKEYVGRGPAATLAAAAVARSKAQTDADRQAVQHEVVRLDAMTRVTGELDAGVGLLLDATLLANGFHRWNHGPWRRKRREQGSRTGAGAGSHQ